MRNKVIILGNDHTNTLGLLYSFNKKGIGCVAALWGRNTGIVRASNYITEIIQAHTVEDCIFELLSRRELAGSLIVAGCDDAAIALSSHQKELSEKYRLPYSSHIKGIATLLEKNVQVTLANEAGLAVPKSWVLTDCAIPEDIVYPCIIKPLVSCEGSKADLIISYNENELKSNLEKVLSRTHRLILQQYIEKDYDFIVHGVSLSNGDVIMPTLIKKDLIYPRNVGLSSYCTIMPLYDSEIQDSICKLLYEMKYVGLFSAEFVRSKHDGKLYFCEANLRNDGKVAMITKAGVNLPYILYCDLLGINCEKEPKLISDVKTAIWEMHHFKSLIARDVSISDWLRQLKTADIFMVYDPNDKKPIIMQFLNAFIGKFFVKKYY